MELLLTIYTRQPHVQVKITCENRFSHTSYIHGGITLDTSTEVVPPLDPIVYGKMLYDTLFPSGTHARRTLEKQPESIVLVTTDYTLDAIPWEYVYGPYGSESEGNFLVLECRFVRGLPIDRRIPTPTLDGDLHLVAVPSNPLSHDLSPLNIEAEWLRLGEIIQGVQHACVLERTRPPTLEQLGLQLANQQFRVIHFMGHGGQSKEGAVLCFEKEDGDLDQISAKKIVLRIRGTVFLICLNACVSATPGLTEFHNLAAALVQQKVPYALGMRFSINDKDALGFSSVFYGHLARGTPIEEAIRQARLTLAESHSWVVGVPVLYTALATPAAGFTSMAGKPAIEDYRPAIEISALPRTEGTFQGRIDELKWLGHLLTGNDRVRIVTIYGSGGQGKTTLAQETIERFAHAWSGGVYAFSFEILPSLSTFITDLAHFLHIDTTAISDIKEIKRRVTAYLAQHRTLIVLDNVDTLIDAVDRNDGSAIQLGQFLQQLPSSMVSLLVTSRIQLGWAEEQVLELGGLSSVEGAALFMQYAPQRTRESDRVSAGKLSEQIEGHPLSLRLLGSTFNASNLLLSDFIITYENHLVEAKNKYRDLSHRQRTLYASIDISIHHLNKRQCNLLSGLWILRTSFRPNDVTRIFDTSYTYAGEDSSVIDSDLDTLWQRGLLVNESVTVGNSTIVFYRLLPTTRVYIEHYLEQAYERDGILASFGHEYYHLVQFLYDHLDTDPSAPLLAQKAREDIERGPDYIKGITQGYYLNCWGWIQHRLGYLDHGRRLLEKALEIAEGSDLELEAHARSNIARVYQRLGEMQQAEYFNRQALALFRKTRDLPGEAAALANKAEAYHNQGQFHDALRLYEQVLPLLREAHDRRNEAVALNNMAAVYADLGQSLEAFDLYSQALSIRQEINDHQGEAVTLSGMANVYRNIGQPQKALNFYQQALPLCQETYDRVGELAILINVALIHGEMGKTAEALRLCQQVLPKCQEIDDQPGVAQVLNITATLYSALGQHGEALHFHQQALSVCRKINNLPGEADALCNMATIYQMLGRHCFDKSLRLYQKALSVYRNSGARKGEATVLSNMAVLYHALGQPQEEFHCNQQALSIRREINDPAGQMATLINMGYVSRDMQNYQEALNAFAQATKIAHQIARPAGECASLVGSATVLYFNLNRAQEGIARMTQAIAILEGVNLPQDASGHTLIDLRKMLVQMQGGTEQS